MKVIVSHDVDHLYWSEHILHDLFVPKHIVKSFFLLAKGDVSIDLCIRRLAALGKNRLHRIPELIAFDKSYGITPTFFVAMKKGLGLSYSNNDAKEIIQYILKQNCHVGIHGMAYDSIEEMKQEQELFRSISGLKQFGIRNHYLRMSENTLNYMSELGYLFDSTTYDIKPPYFINKMKEFPMTMMDAYMLKEKDRDTKQAMQKTKEIINTAFDNKSEFIIINFHDIGFGEIYPMDKEWYMNTIDWIKGQQLPFTSFEQEI